MPTVKFDNSATRDYLSGAVFNENVSFEYEFSRPLRHRMDVLLGLAVGKRVLHIGCCDHIPLVKDKIANGTWLQSRLTDVASSCVGIDIDYDAVEKARAISGLDNIFYGDITSPTKIPQIDEQVFDYVILGEVLEHIGNPVSFLGTFVSNYGANIKNIVITVPNAFTAGNVKNVLKMKETINSDHRFFFTPYTLSKVAWDAGLAPVDVEMAFFTPTGRLKQKFLNKYPLFAENIVYIGAPRAATPA